MKNKRKVGSINQKQKSISNSLILQIKKYQKYLQVQENIKFGRRAKTISFVYATSRPKELANFILNGGEK